MLKQDGLWNSWRNKLRFVREIGSFLRYVSPYILRSVMPFHSPRFEKDLDWVQEWLSRYPSGVTPAAPPLVDTNDPEMPVPAMKFSAAA